MKLQMIRYNGTGEVRVVDTEAMIASDWLHHTDQSAPLGDYDLSHAIEPDDLTDYTVLRAI